MVRTKNCKKCGATHLETFPVFNASSTQAVTETSGIIQMRQNAILSTDKREKRLRVSEIINLPFGLIAEMLRQNDTSPFFFRRNSERILFLVAYPEFKDKHL